MNIQNLLISAGCLLSFLAAMIVTIPLMMVAASADRQAEEMVSLEVERRRQEESEFQKVRKMIDAEIERRRLEDDNFYNQTPANQVP
jgi:single-stranded DNA-specific DHH superfamily exonuclease